MKVEDISDGYFSGPRCDTLDYLENHDSGDNYDYEENYYYEENSGDYEGDIYENEYDYSNEVDEESRSPRDIDSFKQELLKALNILMAWSMHFSTILSKDLP